MLQPWDLAFPSGDSSFISREPGSAPCRKTVSWPISHPLVKGQITASVNEAFTQLVMGIGNGAAGKYYGSVSKG